MPHPIIRLLPIKNTIPILLDFTQLITYLLVSLKSICMLDFDVLHIPRPTSVVL